MAILGTAVFDELIGDQGEHAERAGGLFYAIELYAALPLLLVITIIYVHYLIKTDPIGMVHALSLGGVTFGGATGSGVGRPWQRLPFRPAISTALSA